MADAQLVGQIVAASITALASGGAAFLGSRAANRSTDVTDARVKETAEWDRIYRMVNMAFSSNQTESYVGLDLLEKSKTDWNDSSEQTKFIRRICKALYAAPAQAYRGGQTTVATTFPPPAPGGPS